MKKKLGLITATVALGALLAVGGTLAWFTDTETATNVVTTGNVNISILENGEVKDDNGITFPENQVPGASLEKVVTVANTGANPAYVRVTLDVTGKDGDAELTDDQIALIKAAIKFPESSTWDTDDNEVYYYEGVVAPEGSTEALITGIEIPTTWNNNMTDLQFEVKIVAEAIQSENLLAEGVKAEVTSLKAAFGDAMLDGAPTVPDFDVPAAE